MLIPLVSPSADTRQINRVTRKLKAGTVWVNQVSWRTIAVPAKRHGADTEDVIVLRTFPWGRLRRLQVIRVGSRVGPRGSEHLLDFKGGPPVLRGGL